MSDNYITGKRELDGPESALLGTGPASITVGDTDALTTELALLDLAYTGDRAYVTGTDITYSSARGSSGIKIVSTLTADDGAWSNIYSLINTSGAYTGSGDGVIGVKAVVANTAHLTDGNIYAAQFIAKHNSATNHMHAEACLIGIEAVGYDAATASAGVGVMIGVNAVIRSYATSAYSGGVHRGVQIVVDEATLGATEVTALCIWNMGASAIDGIRIVGADTMAKFLYIDAAGGLLATGHVHGTDSADVKSDYVLKMSLGATALYIPVFDTLG